MTELSKIASKDTVETAVVLAQVVTGLASLTVQVGRMADEQAKANEITRQLCIWQGVVNERHRVEDVEKPKGTPVPGKPLDTVALLNLVLGWVWKFSVATAMIIAGVNVAKIVELVR